MSYSFQTIDNNTDPTFNQLLGVNNGGTIAGYFGNGTNHANKGYTINPPYAQSNFINENFPGSLQTQVTGLNNLGVTVGFWANTLPGTTNTGFVDQGGTFTSVTGPDTTGATPSVTQLLGVNDANIAVGFDVDAAGVTHGFTYNIAAKTFTTVAGPSGAVNVTATGINNEDQVSGFFTTTAGVEDGFVETAPGTYTTLIGPQTGDTNIMALGLNNEGQVVGSYVGTDGNTHGFVYNLSSGAYTTLNNGSGAMTVANGINDLGQVVGFDENANAPGTDGSHTDGFLASIPGSIVTLSNLTAGTTVALPSNYSGLVLSGTQNVTVTTGSSPALIAPGNGNVSIVANGSPDIIFPGGGNDTILAFGSVLTAVGKGQLALLNGSNAATVIGGNTGSDLISGGAGGGLFGGGNGGLNVIYGGAGASTIFGSTGSDLLIAGGSNPDFLIAGSGNETLTGLGSTGANIFYAGAGNDLLGGGSGNETFFSSHGNSTVIGGSGADHYVFVNNLFAGGNETIAGFNTGKGDRIGLQSYAANQAQTAVATQQNAGGNTTLTLSDNTHITFLGVASLNINAFG